MGGTERQITQLATGLEERNVEVVVIARWPLQDDNPYVHYLRAMGIRIITTGFRGPRLHLGYRRAYLRARLGATGRRSHEKTEAALWAWENRVLRRLRSPGTVLHEVPYFGFIAPPGRGVIHRLQMPTVHTVFGNMEGVHATAAAPWAVVTTDGEAAIKGAGEARWIPSMGLAEDAIATAPRRGDTIELIFAGRLVAQKGVRVLIDAVSRLGPQFRLTIAGYGPELEPLRAAARAGGASVSFLGVIPAGEIPAMFASADVAVQPSLHGEGVPSTIAEALGAGTPVIASDVGAVRRLAADQGPGGPLRLVPPGDAPALADAISTIASTAPVLRTGARALFDEKLSPHVVISQYLACYEEARLQAGTLGVDH
jgi:glycosyltransferase involved in cell wall biosynthesis